MLNAVRSRTAALEGVLEREPPHRHWARHGGRVLARDARGVALMPLSIGQSGRECGCAPMELIRIVGESAVETLVSPEVQGPLAHARDAENSAVQRLIEFFCDG